jgi:predicted nucleotidyltransferase component of viral defense system
VQDFQVEQDLVISRALVEIFSHPVLEESLAFRGGTALYKLHLTPPRGIPKISTSFKSKRSPQAR